MEPQNVYVDEAGFTGGNLLDPDQPDLVFSAVAMREAEAETVWLEVLARSKSQGTEVKASNLTSRPRGQAAITWLLENTAEHVRLAAINKRYALAGKFFEYIFEPVLAEKNALFYAIDFHKFIATSLYLSVLAGRGDAAHVFQNFQLLARNPGTSKVTSLYPPNQFNIKEQDPLHHMLNFALCHQDRIEAELRDIAESERYPGWVLELSTTSVHCLLAGWGHEYDSLRVFCDESKPLAADRELFDLMVGRQDKFYAKFGSDRERSIIYNLFEPIQFVDSKHVPGVQIADFWASSLAYAFRHRDDEVCQRWLEIAEPAIDTVLFPDAQLVDIDAERPFLNWTLLMELSDRSINAESVTLGIEDYIAAGKVMYACGQRGSSG